MKHFTNIILEITHLPREMKTYPHMFLYTNIQSTLFLMVIQWKQSKCHRLMNKQNVVYPYDEIIFSHQRNDDTCYNILSLEDIMLNE